LLLSQKRFSLSSFAPSWIIGGSKVLASLIKLQAILVRSANFFTGTCWVRFVVVRIFDFGVLDVFRRLTCAHTAHLPKSARTLIKAYALRGSYPILL